HGGPSRPKKHELSPVATSHRLIVFDLDGTLVDSRRDLADSMNALLAAYGAAPLPEQTIGRMVGEGAAILVARGFAAVGREPPADALARFLRIYDEHLLDHTQPYPRIPTCSIGCAIAPLSPCSPTSRPTRRPSFWRPFLERGLIHPISSTAATYGLGASSIRAGWI